MSDESSGPIRRADSDNFWSAAALQLCEDRIVAHENVVRSGYLRKVTKNGDWRCARCELRRAADDSFELAISADNPDQVEQHRSFFELRPAGGELIDCVVAFRGDDESLKVELLCDYEPDVAGGAEPPSQRCFVLYVQGEVLAWMAASRHDRDGWVRSLQNAINRAKDNVRPIAHEIAKFEAAIVRATAASDRTAFVAALTFMGRGARDDYWSQPDLPVDVPRTRPADPFPASAAHYWVPAKWARARITEMRSQRATNTSAKKKRRSARPSRTRRGSHAAASGSGSESEGSTQSAAQQLSQMRKDMRRDRVSIDDEVVSGTHIDDDAAVPVEAIVRRLATRLLDKAREIRCPLTEAGALHQALVILSACARTSSGGDAYSCVDALCYPCRELVVLCPLSTQASPLELRLSSTVHRRPPSQAGAPTKRRAAAFTPSPTCFSGFGMHASPPSFAQQLLASLYEGQNEVQERRPAPAARGAGDSTPTGAAPDDDAGGIFDDFVDVPEIRIDVRATTAYRVCTVNPQDEPSDTWALVRAVWDQSYVIYGDPDDGPNGANSFASDANVRIAISDFTLWDPSEVASF
mmetsp:Transcript_2801/g.9914  ORF Transcript_2801/g.9914 Transcript_2801/m.9914 type:complete len:581 (+) Transcript_2801:545-2287(+)